MTFVFSAYARVLLSVLMILKPFYDVNEQLRDKLSGFTALLNHANVNEKVVQLRRFTTDCYLGSCVVSSQKGFHPWPATNSHSFCGIKSRRRSADIRISGQQFSGGAATTIRQGLRLS